MCDEAAATENGQLLLSSSLSVNPDQRRFASLSLREPLSPSLKSALFLSLSFSLSNQPKMLLVLHGSLSLPLPPPSSSSYSPPPPPPPPSCCRRRSSSCSLAFSLSKCSLSGSANRYRPEAMPIDTAIRTWSGRPARQARASDIRKKRDRNSLSCSSDDVKEKKVIARHHFLSKKRGRGELFPLSLSLSFSRAFRAPCSFFSRSPTSCMALRAYAPSPPLAAAVKAPSRDSSSSPATATTTSASASIAAGSSRLSSSSFTSTSAPPPVLLLSSDRHRRRRPAAMRRALAGRLAEGLR